MKPMQSVSATEFKAHCLEFLKQVAESGSPILVTKRGKPTAMLAPAPQPQATGWKLGQFKDKVTIVGDLIEPIDVEWEALR